jgi:hypothetical protein
MVSHDLGETWSMLSRVTYDVPDNPPLLRAFLGQDTKPSAYRIFPIRIIPP